MSPVFCNYSGVKEDTWVLKVSHFLLLSWVTVVQAVRALVLSLHAEESDTGLVQSTLPTLSSRVFQVMGPHQVCVLLLVLRRCVRWKIVCNVANKKAVFQLLLWLWLTEYVFLSEWFCPCVPDVGFHLEKFCIGTVEHPDFGLPILSGCC